MHILQKNLNQVNLAQILLLLLPWLLLQTGLLLLMSNRIWAEMAQGVLPFAAIMLVVLLSCWYRHHQIRFLNCLMLAADPDAELYGFTSFGRIWSLQLERTAALAPGYLNMVRLNYACLPLVFLSALMNLWNTALFLLAVWLLTGILYRAALARAVAGQARMIPAPIRLFMILAALVALLAWGFPYVQALRTERQQISPEADIPVHAMVSNAESSLEIPERWEAVVIADILTDPPADLYREMELYLMDARQEIEDLKYLLQNESNHSNPELLSRMALVSAMQILTSASFGNYSALDLYGNDWRRLCAAPGRPGVADADHAVRQAGAQVHILMRLLNESGGLPETALHKEMDRMRATREDLQRIVREAVQSEPSVNQCDATEVRGLGRFLQGLSNVFPAFRWRDARREVDAVALRAKAYEAAGNPDEFRNLRFWYAGLPYRLSVAGPMLDLLRDHIGMHKRLEAAEAAASLVLELRRSGGWRPDAEQSVEVNEGTFPVNAYDPVSGVWREMECRGLLVGGEEGVLLMR